MQVNEAATMLETRKHSHRTSTGIDRHGVDQLNGEGNGHHIGAIPVSQRHGPVTMGLLWITMVTAFPALLIGFEWYRQGFSLKDVFTGVLSSVLIVLAYYIPICFLSARTGLSFKHLSLTVFGSLGSKMLLAPLIFIFLGWYTVCALLMSDAVCGIFALKNMLPLLAAIFSFAMAFNNFFGFKGVANFAKYLAGPVLIAWVLYSFVKIAPAIPAACMKPDSVVSMTALTSIASFTIGFAIWGNEADYWRHSKPRLIPISLALAFALLIGEIIFPITGWLIAFKTGIVDSGVATSYMNQFSFGGLALLAIFVLGANYFAGNDSNLYALTHAFEGVFRFSHKALVFSVACVCALASFLLAKIGATTALEHICALNSVILPVATLLIVAEWFIFKGLTRQQGSETSAVRLPALVSFCTGTAIGLLTSGVFPGLEHLKIGLPPIQAWGIALAIYIPWRLLEQKNRNEKVRSLSLDLKRGTVHAGDN
jgi:purine-cytosine permease-like protein